MDVLTPSTKPVHRELMEYLNLRSGGSEVQWQWGRIASEFESAGNFEFSGGAYSTIDKLLEIAMSKPVEEGVVQEHEHFKILLNCEVRSLVWTEKTTGKASGVRVRAGDGREDVISLTATGSVVLCAGSVASPTILLRSGVDLASPTMGGLHLTDHDIFFRALPFRYRNRHARPHVGAIKLQSYVTPSAASEDAEVVLANISIDASSFLPRGDVLYDNIPKWMIVFVRATDLNPANTIELVDDEPVVKILRAHPTCHQDPTLARLYDLTEKAKSTTGEVLNVEFLQDESPLTTPYPPDNYFRILQLGGVAHELGTIPMKQADGNKAYCVDEDLSLKGYRGVYVCDLSVFPFSPEVNPSLTLAALALRLSRTELHPREPFIIAGAPEPQAIHIINHSGQRIKVWVGNRGNPESASDEFILNSGQMQTLQRQKGITEAAAIFRSYRATSGDTALEFSEDSETMTVFPGKVTAILRNSSTQLQQDVRPRLNRGRAHGLTMRDEMY